MYYLKKTKYETKGIDLSYIYMFVYTPARKPESTHKDDWSNIELYWKNNKPYDVLYAEEADDVRDQLLKIYDKKETKELLTERV